MGWKGGGGIGKKGKEGESGIRWLTETSEGIEFLLLRWLEQTQQAVTSEHAPSFCLKFLLPNYIASHNQETVSAGKKAF